MHRLFAVSIFVVSVISAGFNVMAEETQSSTTLDWQTVSAESDTARASFTEHNYFLKPGVNQFSISGFKNEAKSDRWVPANQNSVRRDYIETTRSEGLKLAFARGLISKTSKTANLMLSLETTLATDSMDYDRERLQLNSFQIERRFGSLKSTGFSDFVVGLTQQNQIATNVNVFLGGKFWLSPTANQMAVQGFQEGNRFSGGNSVNPNLAIEIQSGLMAYSMGIDYKHKLNAKSIFKQSGNEFESESSAGHETKLTGALEYSLEAGQIGFAGDYLITGAQEIVENNNGAISKFDLDASTKWAVRTYGAYALSPMYEVAAQIQYSQLENRKLNGFSIQQENSTDLSLALRSNF